LARVIIGVTDVAKWYIFGRRLTLNAYENIKELRQDVKAYIYFYNYHRYHQTLQYKKPMEVYDYQKYLQNIKRNESVIDHDMLQKVI